MRRAGSALVADVRKLLECIADVAWDSDWHLAEIVAKRARLKHWTVYNWLRGKSSPTPHTIIYLRGIAAQ